MIDEVIGAIRESESRVKCVQFRCEVLRGTTVAKDTKWEIGEADGFPGNSQVLWQIETGRFMAEIDSINRTTTEGKSESDRNTVSASHCVTSNDGAAFQSWYRSRVGTQEIPAADFAGREVERTGLICHSTDMPVRKPSTMFNEYYTGIGWVTPYLQPFWDERQTISDLLHRKRLGGDFVRARVTVAGLWEIHIASTKTSKEPYELRIHYDPHAGRVVTFEGGGSGSTEYRWDDWKVNDVAYFTYEDDSAVIPSLVTAVINVPGSTRAVSRTTQWSYSEQRLNPKVNEGDFRLTFEKGVEVTDYINQKNYVVGLGLEDDKQAVTRFMQMNGLDPSRSGGSPAKSGRKWGWLLVTNGLVFGLIISVLIVRRFGGKPPITGLILFATAHTVLTGSNVWAEESLPRSNTAAANQSPHIQTQQCGHLVTMLALHLRDTDYDLDVFRTELVPTDEGVSLAQIKRLLTAYGLETVARKSLSVDDIDRTVRDGYLAIVPVFVASGRRHYLVVAQQDRTAEPVVINTLYSVRPLATGLTDQQLSIGGGIALFVGEPLTRVSTDPDAKPALQFDPQQVNLGDFEIDGQDQLSPLEVKISLHNDSDRPMLVSELSGSCGCVQPGWNKGIIDARESRSIPVSISRIRCGTGPQQKVLVAKLADGTSTKLQMTGVGVTTATRQGLQVVPESVSFDAGDAFFERESVELVSKSLVVTAASDHLAKLQVKPTATWITTSVIGIDDSHAQITVTVTLNDDIRRELVDGSRTAQAEILTFVDPNNKPISTKVLLSRKPMFTLNSKSVVLAQSEQQVELTVVPRHKNCPQQFQIGSVTTIPPGLSVRHQPTETGQEKIVISRLPETATRAYVVRVEVICTDGHDTINSIVFVK